MERRSDNADGLEGAHCKVSDWSDISHHSNSERVNGLFIARFHHWKLPLCIKNLLMKCWIMVLRKAKQTKEKARKITREEDGTVAVEMCLVNIGFQRQQSSLHHRQRIGMKFGTIVLKLVCMFCLPAESSLLSLLCHFLSVLDALGQGSCCPRLYVHVLCQAVS